MKYFLSTLVLALVVLHQDFWDFNRVEPLVFGFLPISLAYHAAYSVACAVVMFLLVRFAWPRHLEELEPHAQDCPERGGH